MNEFTKKGYELADSDYLSKNSGQVDNIDLILGTDYDHVVPKTYHKFGDFNDVNSLSTYIETPSGIMLSGNMCKIIKKFTLPPPKSS